jgi:hypothetical protein
MNTLIFTTALLLVLGACVNARRFGLSQGQGHGRDFGERHRFGKELEHKELKPEERKHEFGAQRHPGLEALFGPKLNAKDAEEVQRKLSAKLGVLGDQFKEKLENDPRVGEALEKLKAKNEENKSLLKTTFENYRKKLTNALHSLPDPLHFFHRKGAEKHEEKHDEEEKKAAEKEAAEKEAAEKEAAEKEATEKQAADKEAAEKEAAEKEAAEKQAAEEEAAEKKAAEEEAAEKEAAEKQAAEEEAAKSLEEEKQDAEKEAAEKPGGEKALLDNKLASLFGKVRFNLYMPIICALHCNSNYRTNTEIRIMILWN